VFVWRKGREELRQQADCREWNLYPLCGLPED